MHARGGRLSEFVRAAVALTLAREASRFGTALCRQDPVDPVDSVHVQKCLQYFFMKTVYISVFGDPESANVCNGPTGGAAPPPGQ